MGKSRIEWTEETWNPVVGCSVLTPGCTNCYAMRDAWRKNTNPNLPRYHGLTKIVNGKPVWTGELRLAPDSTLLKPLKTKKPTMFFVNSMGDLFHEDAPDEWIDKVFAVMALAPQHTFQVLTKRAERMRQYVLQAEHRIYQYHAVRCWVGGECQLTGDVSPFRMEQLRHFQWPLSNVWLGVSTERQREADERIPELLQTPATVRFISAEPLLGPLDLTKIMRRAHDWTYCDNALTGFRAHKCGGSEEAKLDWVIVGGESGANARPMHPDWARSLRQQCAAAGTKFFFKQWGEFEVAIDRDRDDPDWRRDYSGELSDRSNRAWLNLAGGRGFHGERFHVMRKVGKKASGRALDGIYHDEFPERVR